MAGLRPAMETVLNADAMRFRQRLRMGYLERSVLRLISISPLNYLMTKRLSMTCLQTSQRLIPPHAKLEAPGGNAPP